MVDFIEDFDAEDDLYSVIGCASSSNQEQITTEYRKKIILHHPDKVGGETTKEYERYVRSRIVCFEKVFPQSIPKRPNYLYPAQHGQCCLK